MKDNDKVCECVHEKSKPVDGLSFSKVKNKCCTEETTELTNSNTLLTFKTELPQNISVLGPIAINPVLNDAQFSGSSTDIIIDKPHYPKLDIPILTSSFLI